MRNFDEEIKELTRDIENLEVTKNKKKAQLQLLKKVKRETQEAEQASVAAVDRTARDHHGKQILIGDWVIVKRKGKFKGTEGTVVNIKKWLTFEDRQGIRQSRASHNLIVSDFPASYHGRKRRTRSSTKS